MRQSENSLLRYIRIKMYALNLLSFVYLSFWTESLLYCWWTLSFLVNCSIAQLYGLTLFKAMQSILSVVVLFRNSWEKTVTYLSWNSSESGKCHDGRRTNWLSSWLVDELQDYNSNFSWDWLRCYDLLFIPHGNFKPLIC